MKAKHIRKGCVVKAKGRIPDEGEVVDPEQVGKVLQNVSGVSYLEPEHRDKEVLLVDLPNGSSRHWVFDPEQVVEVYGVDIRGAA